VRTLPDLCADNSVPPPGAEMIANMLQVNTSICRLDLNGVDELATRLVSYTRLIEDCIAAKGFAFIAKALESRPSLTHLSLYGSFIMDAGVQMLAPIIQERTTPLTVDLRWNMITTAGAELLYAALLKSNACISLQLQSTLHFAFSHVLIIFCGQTIRLIKRF